MYSATPPPNKNKKRIQSCFKAVINLITSGHWRLLDMDYKERVVVSILTLLEEKDWSYDAVPAKECCDVLEELEPRFVRLQSFT